MLNLKLKWRKLNFYWNIGCIYLIVKVSIANETSIHSFVFLQTTSAQACTICPRYYWTNTVVHNYWHIFKTIPMSPPISRELPEGHLSMPSARPVSSLPMGGQRRPLTTKNYGPRSNKSSIKLAPIQHDRTHLVRQSTFTAFNQL